MKHYNPDICLVGGYMPFSSNSHLFQITPEQFIGNDTSRINQAIDFASDNLLYNVVCNGVYYLDSAILIKSNVNLINNGQIIMKSGMKDNIVRSSVTTVGNPLINVKIKGVGIFKGSSDTWGSDSPSGVGGESWRSIAVLLANVIDFEIEGITIKNSHGWGICLEQSRFGSVKNVHFDNDGTKGNQDGVNVRRGSHHVVVENISGTTYDDIVAVTNLIIRNDLNYLGTTIYETGKLNFNMHDIMIRNINRITPPKVIFPSVVPTHYSGGILLLCEDGLKIHDVSIDGVTGYGQICLGFTFYDYSQTVDATVDDMFNISVSNTGNAPVYTLRPIKNASLINIPNFDINGAYQSANFKVGSLNVTRKYHNANFEFFATV
jgi:hypothetical protein